MLLCRMITSSYDNYSQKYLHHNVIVIIFSNEGALYYYLAVNTSYNSKKQTYLFDVRIVHLYHMAFKKSVQSEFKLTIRVDFNRSSEAHPYREREASIIGACIKFITSWVPINKKKVWPTYDEIIMKPMMKWWWNLWWNCCETVSKCLAHMKGCWDPEFEPSVEEIMNYWWYMAILSVRFPWRARTLGDFPIQSRSWQVEVTSGSTGLSHAPQYTRIWSMRSLSMCLKLIMVAYSRHSEYFSWGRGM